MDRSVTVALTPTMVIVICFDILAPDAHDDRD